MNKRVLSESMTKIRKNKEKFWKKSKFLQKRFQLLKRKPMKFIRKWILQKLYENHVKIWIKWNWRTSSGFNSEKTVKCFSNESEIYEKYLIKNLTLIILTHIKVLKSTENYEIFFWGLKIKKYFCENPVKSKSSCREIHSKKSQINLVPSIKRTIAHKNDFHSMD